MCMYVYNIYIYICCHIFFTKCYHFFSPSCRRLRRDLPEKKKSMGGPLGGDMSAFGISVGHQALGNVGPYSVFFCQDLFSGGKDFSGALRDYLDALCGGTIRSYELSFPTTWSRCSFKHHVVFFSRMKWKGVAWCSMVQWWHWDAPSMWKNLPYTQYMGLVFDAYKTYKYEIFVISQLHMLIVTWILEPEMV